MIHRYSDTALLPDYLRAAAGFGIGLALLIFTEVSSVMFYIAAGLTGLFLAFSLRLLARRLTPIEIDGAGIAASPAWGGGKRIDWEAIQDVAIRYFSTKRDRSDGWLQLDVRGGGRRISADSTISDFPGLVTAVTSAARQRGIELSPTTLANLGALNAPGLAGGNGVGGGR